VTVDERERLAEGFEANWIVADRMLGSRSEADGAVQEAWLPLSRAQATGVDDLRAWRTTVVVRVSLDMLRSRKSRREEPLGPHMPEPIVSREDWPAPDHICRRVARGAHRTPARDGRRPAQDGRCGADLPAAPKAVLRRREAAARPRTARL
jgi:DNA-directed RNA polymerase specialized sigma24 family protein